MAKKRDISSPLNNVSFKCPDCGHKFAVPPVRVEDAPDKTHPFEYFANCTICNAESKQVPWEKALMASFGKHTGPKTEDGKAKSIANLDGHPTPEETLRTRFNAMKTGLSARVARYFPAKPGSYPHCSNCPIDFDDCRNEVACMKRTELFMRHDIAFQSKDPSLLTDIRADMQSGVQAIIDDMLLALASDGVVLKHPKFHFDKDGNFSIAEYLNEEGKLVVIENVEAHPILKPLMDFISKNGLSLGDLGMTPKAVEKTETEMGNLAEKEADKESLLEYRAQQNKQLENLSGLIERSQRRIKDDPVVIEYNDG